MPPISRTQVAPVLKAKDYALIETYSTELLNALTICNSIFALHGGEMVTHTGNPFYGEALRTRVRFPPPPQYIQTKYDYLRIIII